MCYLTPIQYTVLTVLIISSIVFKIFEILTNNIAFEFLYSFSIVSIGFCCGYAVITQK